MQKIRLLLFVLILAVGICNKSVAQNVVSTNETEAKSVEIDPTVFVQNFLVPIPVPQKNADLKNNDGSDRVVLREAKKEKIGDGMMNWVKEKYADVLNILPGQITNVMLYRFIDDWYGVKYRMGGTSKKGVDCSAFVQNLYQFVFGLDLLRTARMQFSESQYIKKIEDLKEGDLVFFKINSTNISHVGVYLRNNFFVHSASSKGVSIASLGSDYWHKYFVGGGRIIQ